MRLGGICLAKSFKRHTKAAMKTARIPAECHGLHVGIPAVDKPAVPPIAVPHAMKQIGV